MYVLRAGPVTRDMRSSRGHSFPRWTQVFCSLDMTIQLRRRRVRGLDSELYYENGVRMTVLSRDRAAGDPTARGTTTMRSR
jgi:hypothetical protein